MSTCRGCGKEIVWAKTSNGANIAMDPKALVLSVLPEGGKLIAIKPIGVQGERWLVVHWATCPNAEDFHKKPDPQPQRHFSEPEEPA